MDALRMLTEDEIDKGVYNLSDEEKVYLKLLISHLVRGFSDDDYSCVLVMGQNKKGTVSVCSVNAGEEQATEMLSHAYDVMSFADTVGAPAKGEFH